MVREDLTKIMQDRFHKEIREAIEAGNYQEYKKRKLEGMQKISRN